MDLNGSIEVLARYPVSDLSEFKRVKETFDKFLTAAGEEELKAVLRKLRCLKVIGFNPRCLIFKYKYYIERRVSGVEGDRLPKIREDYFTEDLDLKQISDEKKRLSGLVDLYRRRFVQILKLDYHNIINSSRIFDLTRNKIKIYSFYLKIFKENRDKIKLTSEYFNNISIMLLKSHSKIFRKKNKLLSLANIALTRISFVLYLLKKKIEPATPSPAKLRKDNKKLLELIDKKFFIAKSCFISDLKNPEFRKRKGFILIQQRLYDYYKRFLYIQFVNRIEKKSYSLKIMNFLVISGLVKHSRKFNCSQRSIKYLKNLGHKRIKKTFLRVVKSSKLFQNNCKKFQKGSENLDKLIKKIGLKLIKGLNLSLILNEFLNTFVSKGFRQVLSHSNEVKKNLEFLLRFWNKKRILNFLIEFCKNFNRIERFKKFVIHKAHQKVRSLNIKKAVKDLQILKNSLSLLTFRNLFLFRKETKSIIQKIQTIQNLTTVKQNRVQLSKRFFLIHDLFTKKHYFSLFKKIPKLKKFKFPNSSLLQDLSDSLNESFLSLGLEDSSIEACKSAQSCLDLLSEISSSFLNQRKNLKNIEKKNEKLEISISETKKMLDVTERNWADFNERIQKINESKEKFISSQAILDELRGDLSVLDEESRDLAGELSEIVRLDDDLESEFIDLTRTYTNLDIQCREYEHEISRIEVEYNSKLSAGDSLRMFSKTGMSFSPSPYKMSSIRSENSPKRSSVISTPRSPERVRGRRIDNDSFMSPRISKINKYG